MSSSAETIKLITVSRLIITVALLQLLTSTHIRECYEEKRNG